MGTTIVGIIQMKILCIVLKGHVHKIVSVARTTGAFRPLGTAMEMTTVEMELMNPQSIANQKDEPVSGIFSHVTMAIAFQGFTFVMGTTIVWTTVTKMTDINVTTASVTKKQNSPAKRIRLGDVLSASLKSGFAMETQIV